MSYYDSSTLTKLKGDRNQAAYVVRQNHLKAAAQPGVFYSWNPDFRFQISD